MMASRSHVDISERRLRPIYDSLDNGNNKKAIQEVDRVLKKQKDFTCAKVLKALALLRMGKHAEGSAILSAIHASHPTEEQTLNAMSICYKETQQYKNIASLYEAAAKKEPSNEDILSCLFMAHVRLGNYQQQQRTAMLLHKLRPSKNPYYFWAVMSIVMQAHKDPKLGRSMYLPLAEKMTQRYIQDERIEAEAEILLYLIILELQEKWEEAVTVLEGPLGAQLGNEINLRERRLADVCTQIGKWDKVNCIYKQQLNKLPDDWTFWLKYLEAGFHMVDAGWSPDGPEDNGHQQDEDSPVTADGTVQMMKSYIDSKIEEGKEGVLQRGPYLAQLEYLKQLMKRELPYESKAQTLLQEYYELFGHKSCCFGDMKLYVDLLADKELDHLMEAMKANANLASTDDTIKHAEDVKQLTRHLVYLQLCRTTGQHDKMSDEDALALSKELLARFWDGLKFGKELLSTDLQYSDNYLLLSAHLLLDVWKRTGNDIHIWRAIVHLELGVRESVSNFQFKLLLIQLYCNKGVFGPCPALYDGMEIKHIMNDTMGHIVSNHVVRLGHFMEAGTMYTTMVRFFVVNQKEASEHLMSSYKFGSFGRIQEFVEFQDRLDNSLQHHSAHTEKMLLDLIMQTDRHDATETAVEFMHRQTKTSDNLDLQNIRDNRDLKIALAWDPAAKLKNKENQENSLEEEKAWLQLRWLQLQILLSAVWVGRHAATEIDGSGTAATTPTTNSSSTVVNGNQEESTDGEKDSADHHLALMKKREKELREFATQCSHFTKPRQYNLCQGPFRTRISTYLTDPHLELMSVMVQCIDRCQELHKNGLNLENISTTEPCWSKVEELAKDLIVKDVQGLLRDSSNGRRQMDSTELEQLVASVESISYVTLLTGACNRLLKPIKTSLAKKSRKNRALASPHLSNFEKFNHLVSELSNVTKELHSIASSLDPVFSSMDIASLRLADIPEEEELQREAERLVWSKVESSVQQSSREICEVLHHKQFYLNTLML